MAFSWDSPPPRTPAGQPAPWRFQGQVAAIDSRRPWRFQGQARRAGPRPARGHRAFPSRISNAMPTAIFPTWQWESARPDRQGADAARLLDARSGAAKTARHHAFGHSDNWCQKGTPKPLGVDSSKRHVRRHRAESDRTHNAHTQQRLSYLKFSYRTTSSPIVQRVCALLCSPCSDSATPVGRSNVTEAGKENSSPPQKK